MVKVVKFVIALGVVSRAGPLGAHDLPVSNIRMVAGTDYLHVQLVLNAAELSFFSTHRGNASGRIDRSELLDGGEEIARRILDYLTVRVDGTPVVAEVCGIVPGLDTHHLTVRAHYPADARAAPVSLESRLAAITHGSHVTQVTFSGPEKTEAARLDVHSPAALFRGVEKSIPAASRPEEPPADSAAVWLWLALLMVPGVAVPAAILLCMLTRGKIEKDAKCTIDTD